VSPRLVVVSAGPGSSVQDRGRPGLLRFGLSPGGACDPVALAAANVLVGNPPDAAAVECTYAGDAYLVEADACTLAVAGDAEVAVDGAPAAAWTALVLRRGQTLTVGRIRSGARAYVAAGGGFDLPEVLGGRGAHLKTGIGGGRLSAGDALPLAAPGQGGRLRLDPADLPYVPGPLRVVLGPQDDMVGPDGVRAFLETAWRAGAAADRMGVRLEGPPVPLAGGHDTISEGVAPGTVQVPGNGLPIVLLAERQSTGGYPKIATVVRACIPSAGRIRPGDGVRFAAVSPAEGAALLRRQADALASLPSRLRPTARDPARIGAEELLSVNLVDGVVDARRGVPP